MSRYSHALIALLAAAVLFAALGLAASTLIRFAAPERLWLLALPSSMVGAYGSYVVWRGRLAEALGSRETVLSMAGSWSRRRSMARAALTIAAVALLVLALARPQWGEQTREVTRKGIDVVFALDISRSMLAGDVAPSRLDAAVAEMDRLMRLLDGDRVGLVVFAGIAFVQSPLTSDYGAIRLYLDRLSPDDLPTQGTAIGRALTEATRLLTGGEDEGQFERAESQLVIVFTDGEDHETDPIAAAVAAREQGIHVYTVGVGTPDGARIPIRDRDGSIREYLTDREGQVVVTRIEEEQLTRIADAGGGEYVRHSIDGAAAAVLEDAIEAFDEQALSSALRQEYRDRFAFFLVPAFLLLAFASALGERRRSGRLVAALAVLSALAPGCDDGLLREDPRVERAMRTLAEGEPEAALEALERAPEEAGERPEFHYDRGLILEALSRPREAQDSFLRALAVERPERQVSALFALGNALLTQEQYETAIERYRRALVLDPTHEGARRNLEIAMLRLYPPCSELDDEHEDNDGPDTAGSLDPSVYQGDYLPPGVEPPADHQNEPPTLVSCGGDTDWWAIPVIGGATLDVSVRFSRLRDDNGHEPLPETIEPTAVRIALIDVDKETPLAVDQGLAEVAEGATIDAHDVVRTLVDVPISPTVDENGVAYLQIQSDAPLEYEYEVQITLTPPCWALEDGYESNDFREHATPLSVDGNYDARICVTNDDWYARELGAGDSFFADIAAPLRDDGEPGAIEFGVYTGDSQDPERRVRLEGSADSVTMISVPEPSSIAMSISSLDETEGNYRLQTHHFGPCPDNDRFEPNDQSSEAHEIAPDGEQPPFRHLRLCEGDQDWFALPLPEVPEEERDNPEYRPFSALAEINGPAVPIEVAVYDPATRQRVAISTPVQAADPEALVQGAPEAGAVAFARLPWETQSVYVVVYGLPTFYHLSFPHTEEQEQPQQQPQDGESEEQQQAEQDQQQEGEGEQSEQQQAGQEQAEQGEQEQQAEQAELGEPSDEQRELLMQLLDSLEPEDVNLPLQQAMEAAPRQPMRNEW